MGVDVLNVMSAPWTTVLTLASGYAAYFVAHTGLREHHQPVDQAFRVVFYGFWGLFAYVAAGTYLGAGILGASSACMAFAIGLGAAWRRWGRVALTKTMRSGHISMSDDLPTAWAALAEAGERVVVSQLKVRLCDGTMMFCRDLSLFRHAPNGPCVLGGSGDILMYVTDIGRQCADGTVEWSQPANLSDDHHGSAVTYIPRDQIARVEIRRKPR